MLTDNMPLWKALNITDYEYNLICKSLGRTPNELEIYLFSAMWSEHCGYKHSKKYLRKLPKTNAILPDENAGGVKIGDYYIFFKVESHNHPSAVEPFQGAATGIGGIIRDILALGARPIALLDSLKFGPLNIDRDKYLCEGVVDGISSYGNCIGVPTVGGETFFDAAYSGSPLVNVMAVGLIHKDNVVKSAAKPGKKVVLIGSHTGRDGIHGASFASKNLVENVLKDRPSVQIGDPFTKKLLIEATLEILKLKGIMACQDCGAAGLLSSTSEMVHKGKCGVELFLDKVHTREAGMVPWEIMLSESQERMIFVVEENTVNKVLEIAKKYQLTASIIGETIPTSRYKLYWYNEKVADLPADILNEPPEYDLEQASISCENRDYTVQKQKIDPKEAIIKLISNENFACKSYIYKQYDYTVGTRTVVPPGLGCAGLWLEETGGVIGITMDSDPLKVYLDPFNGSECTVWESYRNLIANGYKPLGITNCLNFGNPENAVVGHQLVESINGISKACKDIGIPVVSGNVSLYNESSNNRILPTPTIGMIGYCESVNSLIPSSFSDNQTVFVIGKQVNQNSDTGGSLYQRILYNEINGKVDTVDINLEKNLEKVIQKLKEQSLLKGCIDVSKGGIFFALFSALYAEKTGFTGDFEIDEKLLFGEITGRYLISTDDPENTENYLVKASIPFKKLGICGGNLLKLGDLEFDINALFEVYENSLEMRLRS